MVVHQKLLVQSFTTATVRGNLSKLPPEGGHGQALVLFIPWGYHVYAYQDTPWHNMHTPTGQHANLLLKQERSHTSPNSGLQAYLYNSGDGMIHVPTHRMPTLYIQPTICHTYPTQHFQGGWGAQTRICLVLADLICPIFSLYLSSNGGRLSAANSICT